MTKIENFISEEDIISKDDVLEIYLKEKKQIYEKEKETIDKILKEINESFNKVTKFGYNRIKYQTKLQLSDYTQNEIINIYETTIFILQTRNYHIIDFGFSFKNDAIYDIDSIPLFIDLTCSYEKNSKNKYQITDVIKNGNDVYQEKNNLKDEYINNKIKEFIKELNEELKKQYYSKIKQGNIYIEHPFYKDREFMDSNDYFKITMHIFEVLQKKGYMDKRMHPKLTSFPYILNEFKGFTIERFNI